MYKSAKRLKVKVFIDSLTYLVKVFKILKKNWLISKLFMVKIVTSEPFNYRAVVFIHSKHEQRFSSYKKFQTYAPLYL